MLALNGLKCSWSDQTEGWLNLRSCNPFRATGLFLYPENIRKSLFYFYSLVSSGVRWFKLLFAQLNCDYVRLVKSFNSN